MRFNELPKQKQLLVYMLNYEASTSGEYKPFTVAEYADDVISYGITKNKSSLSSMLSTLSNKGYVKSNGYGWTLTAEGADEADYWMMQCDDIDDSLLETHPTKQDIDDRRLADDSLQEAAISMAVAKVELHKEIASVVKVLENVSQSFSSIFDGLVKALNRSGTAAEERLQKAIDKVQVARSFPKNA